MIFQKVATYLAGKLLMMALWVAFPQVIFSLIQMEMEHSKEQFLPKIMVDFVRFVIFFDPLKLTDKSVFKIRLKGDGKKYQFRVKKSESDYYSYIYEFQTSTEWETIEIPINKLYASFRGRTLQLPNYDGQSWEEIAFLIGNKRNENFELLIDKIEVE